MDVYVRDILNEACKRGQMQDNGIILPHWTLDTACCTPGSQWLYCGNIYIAVKTSGKNTEAGSVKPDSSPVYWTSLDLSALRGLVGKLLERTQLLDQIRLNQIGVPKYHPSTEKLPANHVWVNGDFIPFVGHEEFKIAYQEGFFSGMLLPHDASVASQLENRGMFRPNDANPTGLYLPTLGDAFVRSWTNGLTRKGGSFQTGAMKNLKGSFSVSSGTNYGSVASYYPVDNTTGVFSAITRPENLFVGGGWNGCDRNRQYKAVFDASTQVETADEFRPPNTSLPVIMYIGEPGSFTY